MLALKRGHLRLRTRRGQRSRSALCHPDVRRLRPRAPWCGSVVWAEDRQELSEKVHGPGSRWAEEDSLRKQAGAGPQNLQAEDAEEVSQSDCVDGGGGRQDLPNSPFRGVPFNVPSVVPTFDAIKISERAFCTAASGRQPHRLRKSRLTLFLNFLSSRERLRATKARLDSVRGP